jgi:3-oxoacyl-[acyl-carrier protein] reductase
MSDSLRDRVALITGGTRGIGRATALACAGAGADVVVAYHADEAAATDVHAELEALGHRSLLVRADVSDTAECERLVAEALRTFGKIDIFVSNAGLGGPKNVLETTDADYTAIFDTNVKAFLALTRGVLPGMMERRYGRIVAISSIIGQTGQGYFSKATYGAAKAALITYVKGLAREAAAWNITANAIAPGWIDTGRNNTPEKAPVRERALREIPLGRLGRPEDVAQTALFLVGDGAAYITGATIPVNGGLLMP